MNANSLLPGKFVKAADLNGKDVTLTIDGLALEMVGNDNDAEEKPVLRFREREQGFVLNKTNINAIVDLYGSETNDWEGKQIVLFPTRTQYGGRMVDCVRVREPRLTEKVEAGADNTGSGTPF